MKKTTPKPPVKRTYKKHDGLAKRFFYNVPVARKFLEIYLPDDIKELCDLDKLTLKSSAHVKSNLKRRTSDILYQVELKQKQGIAIIYFMIEVQSTEEALMSLRVLEYEMLTLDSYTKEHPKTEKLPLIIPFVFYNGKTPYEYPTKMEQLFELQEIYKQIPLGDFILVDITKMQDQVIATHGKLAVLESAKKHVRNANKSESMEAFAKSLESAYNDKLSMELLYSIYCYLVDHVKPDGVQYLQDAISSYLPYFERETMDYIEKIEKKAEKRGIHEGIHQGEVKARYEIAVELLSLGTDPKIAAKATHLTLTEINKLKSGLRAR